MKIFLTRNIQGKNMANYYIKEIEYYVPERIIDNDFLSAESGIDKSFTEDKVGIKERRISLDNEPTSALAFKSAQKLFESSDVPKEDVDMLLLCTQNPDYRLPTTACIVQDMLQMKKSIMAFDINLGCSGFVYSLPLAGNFIKSGDFKNTLLIMAEEYSKVIDFKDRNTVSIFGDAGCSILLGKCEDGYGVLDYNFGTDGSGAKHLIVHNSGVVKDETKNNYLFMDGREIFKFSMMTIPKSINAILEKNQLKIEDFKYFVFHQANKYMLKELQKRMKISDEQMIIDLEMIGNTVSCTIPIAYKNLISQRKLNRGDLVLFTGFGVGLSWGNVIYRYY